MRKLIIVIAAWLCIFIDASASLADKYNISSNTCIPSSSDYTSLSFVHDEDAVRHSGENTSAITLHCSIPFDLVSPSRLELIYADADTSELTLVKASYTKMHNDTGALTTIATVTSENGIEDGTMRLITEAISDTHDTSIYFYFVSVTITRASSSDIAIAYGASVY